MKAVATALLLLALALLGGCERAMQNMYDQPRYDPYEAAPELPGGGSARALPQGSVARASGVLAGTSSARHGEDAVLAADRAAAATTMPYPITPELLQHGRDRYTIYCAPCHSPVGDGDGLVARRGFPHPPSYHIPRLRAAPDRHFYDVMTNGYGIMYSYAERVQPADRWAIVAYIRALQLSQHAPVDALPAQARRQLQAQGASR